MKQFQIPDEIELIGFFGAEPIERSLEDGYWRFEIRDVTGVALSFGFNVFERSAQISLSVAGCTYVTVSHEFADRLLLLNDQLVCEFSSRDSRGSLILRRGDRVSAIWSTLRTQ
jgi:hypothetical protein